MRPGVCILDDVQLANYVAGIDPGPVDAGRTDREIARLLGVGVGTPIWLSDYTLTKTWAFHTDVTFEDYQNIPNVLIHGFVVPGSKSRTIQLYHVDTSQKTYRMWRVCLKSTSQNEVFVTLLHRAHMKELRRVYRRAVRRGELLRDHKHQLARHMLRRASEREGGAP